MLCPKMLSAHFCKHVDRTNTLMDIDNSQQIKYILPLGGGVAKQLPFCWILLEVLLAEKVGLIVLGPSSLATR